jgi:putative MATE family efflux protein
MTSADKGDLTTGSLRAHLIRLTIPMIWGILAMISFQLVNTFYISLLGTEKLAAISFTFPITYIIFAVFLGFGIGMSSVVSRLIGEKRIDDIKRVTTHGLVMVVIAGALVAAAGLMLMNPLFRAMGADDAMLRMIDDYMNIYYIGTAFICMPIVGNAALRAGGDTLTPALIMTGAALANALLDPLLIFGLFGFPRLELQGAAISTVLANGGAMIAGLSVLKRRNMISWHYLKDISRFGDSAKRLLFIAIPAGLTSAVPSILNSVIISLLSKSGAAPVAAFGVVNRVEAFVFVIMMALAVGMAPIIGQNWGAARYDRVRETLRLAIAFCVIWSVFVALVLGLFGDLIAAGFSKDPEVLKIIVLYFMLVPFSYPFSNIVSGWGSAFNAMGKPQYSAGMIFLKMIVILIPAVHIGYSFYGVTGIFGAMAVVNVITGVAFHMFGRNVCNSAAVQQPALSSSKAG